MLWVCRACRAGAVTLPILRQAAPRAFVNQLWQAARHHGRPSAFTCPTCTQPFTTFGGAGVAVPLQLLVCVRCFWVWLSPKALSSGSAVATLPPARGPDHALVQGAARDELAAPGDARQVLSSLVAGVLRRVL